MRKRRFVPSGAHAMPVMLETVDSHVVSVKPGAFTRSALAHDGQAITSVASKMRNSFMGEPPSQIVQHLRHRLRVIGAQARV
jgi:hypothetical protein